MCTVIAATLMIGLAALLIALVVMPPVSQFLCLVWHLGGRPLAMSLGLIEPTADDFVVRGWKAERGGQWTDALAAYDNAFRLRPLDQEVEARRVGLIQRSPNLAAEAEAQMELLATLDPLEVLNHLSEEPTNRKLVLVAVACCQRVWHLLTDERSRSAVEEAEKHADQPPPEDEAVAIQVAALLALGVLEGTEPDALRNARAAAVMCLACRWNAHYGTLRVLRLTASTIGRNEQVRLLGCIFGLPHHTREAVPSWLTSTVLVLARQMYESQDFSLMLILADALQDAGCDNEDILNHCRQPGEHARGCWVVDLLLAKE